MLYSHVSKELPMSRSAYESSILGWGISPILIDEQMVGAMMVLGQEHHICLDPEKAKIHARRLIRTHLFDAIKKHGYLTTIAFKDERQTRFIERLGFYKTGEDETFYFYRIDQPKIS